MSRQDAKRLLQDFLADDKLLAQLQEKTLEEATEAARGLGYDVTEEEFAAEVEEYRATKAEEPVEPLEEELDQIAGGVWGTGEIAPDGHEMGCFIPWHGRSWALDSDTYCNHNFYCYTHWDECVREGRTSERLTL